MKRDSQVLRRNYVGVGVGDYRTRDDVVELPNIARPRILFERVYRALENTCFRFRMPLYLSQK